MFKKDKYYYSDAMYQLEINLHKIRKELITMLEFYEQTDCENCLLLKCKCPKTDTKSTKDSQPNNKSDNKSNNEPYENEAKIQVSPPATALPKPKWKNDQSPAPSTPEKLTEPQDIETWMEASMKVEDNFEKVVLNPKKSLVTIESVRPADLPLKTLQKSCILNSSSFSKSSTSNLLNDANFLNRLNISNGPNIISQHFVDSATLEAFFKYLKPRINDTNVYKPAKLEQFKQNYSYF